MAQTVKGWGADAGGGGRRPRAHVSVRVWRRAAGMSQGLFLFAGAVDAEALHEVMQKVQRLTRAAPPGRWRVEVLATGLDGALAHDVQMALWELQRCGVQARLAHAPQLRPELRALLARAALLPARQ